MSSILEQLERELADRNKGFKFKHDTPTGTPSTPYMYGPGGLFGVVGAERELFSTAVHARGLASALPARGSMMMSPLFPYMTGFQDTTGSDPDGVCDDAKTAGPMKSCYQTAAFGRYTYMTRELELNRLGQQINRGDFQDLVLMNGPFMENMGGVVNPDVNNNPTLSNEVLVRMLELGVAFQNKLLRQLYIANPANNSAGGGYAEFPGLDILIGTNKQDAITGATCTSLNSDIKDYNYGKVDDGNLVNTLTYLMRYLRWNAERGFFNPVRWILAMRPALFYELTAIWPCSYLTYRCAGNANANVTNGLTFDANDVIQMRDSMRNGNYLIVDGFRYDVVLDEGIVEETAGDNGNIDEGCFASDIYVIPMSVGGNIAVTYWEYMNYSQGAMVGAQTGNYAPGDFWTDGGRYLWHKKPPKNWCVQWIAKVEPRVILRTPHLAGRLLNVQYCPLQHEREPFPDDPYHLNGGVSVPRATTTYYSDWNLRG